MPIVTAKFERPLEAKTPTSIRLQGLFAKISLRELSGFAGSGFDVFAAVQKPSEKPNTHSSDNKEQDRPAEKYFLNGAQYLTGGVGNRLEFS
ncbi:MAG: hypothetical protein ACI861_001587 [Paracoccaceae bacterium]|jgi:hypothetical protein